MKHPSLDSVREPHNQPGLSEMENGSYLATTHSLSRRNTCFKSCLFEIIHSNALSLKVSALIESTLWHKHLTLEMEKKLGMPKIEG